MPVLDNLAPQISKSINDENTQTCIEKYETKQYQLKLNLLELNIFCSETNLI